MLPLTKLCRYIYLHYEEFLPVTACNYICLNDKVIGISYDLIVNVNYITLRISDNSYVKYIYNLNKSEHTISLILNNSEIIMIESYKTPMIFYLKAFFENPNFNTREWNLYPCYTTNYESKYDALPCTDKLNITHPKPQNYIEHYKSRLPMYKSDQIPGISLIKGVSSNDNKDYYMKSYCLMRTYDTV
jgi:hypothetical protein